MVGDDARVKWPNDIVFARGGRLAKLAGILIEGRPQEGWAVLGIGVNVAVRVEELPAELRDSAASLGRSSEELEPLLARLLVALEQRLGQPPDEILDAWRARDALRGREISWAGGRGRAGGIDGDGRLESRSPTAGTPHWMLGRFTLRWAIEVALHGRRVERHSPLREGPAGPDTRLLERPSKDAVGRLLSRDSSLRRLSRPMRWLGWNDERERAHRLRRPP